MTDDLPPLPYPQMPGRDYTGSDMQAYARAAVRAALAQQQQQQQQAEPVNAELVAALARLLACSEAEGDPASKDTIAAEAAARAALARAALAQQQAELCVSVSRLASMTEPLDGLEKSQPGYHWKRGWNDALRRAMDYAASPAEPGVQHD